ncbi:MAG: hypothetical protein ABSB52_11065 [Acidimicrobiales bacterium]
MGPAQSAKRHGDTEVPFSQVISHAGVAMLPSSGNTLCAMWPNLADEALVLGDEEVRFADLLLLGVASGLVEKARDSTRRGIWALEQADLELPREKVLEEAVVFRRARRLEAGQDLRAWLEARLLTMDEWETHLRRSLAARQFATSPVPGDTAETGLESRAFVVDLICGGWWRRFADLEIRLWAASKLLGDGLDDAGDMSSETGLIIAMLDPYITLERSWYVEGLRKLRGRERALEESARRFANDEAVAARILEHASEWTDLRFAELLLPTREAANEALLCAREDGLSAADLAARSALPLLEVHARHDALPVAAASLLDGALADEPFGPVLLEGKWAVLWLRERHRPSLDDEATRAAASAELLDEALERAKQGLVREVSPL